jgi:TIR domain
MEPGLDYEAAITDAIESCAVVLVIIGPQWLTVTDESGSRRLNDPGDLVRLEIEVALRAPQTRVIPVLVGGARMPQPRELPLGLAALARLQAQTLSDLHWRQDVSQLVDILVARAAERTKA